MQNPPSTVPFAEFVLRQTQHPPSMFVSKLLACSAMLFLTRADPDQLRSLMHKWACRFISDRSRLLQIIRKNSPCSNGRGRVMQSSSSDTLDQASVGSNSSEVAELVGKLKAILHSLVTMYFSWNWHRTEYVIQINKEYEAYLRENVLPICIATSVEDGVDDEEPIPCSSPSSAGRTHQTASETSIANLYSPAFASKARSGPVINVPQSSERGLSDYIRFNPDRESFRSLRSSGRHFTFVSPSSTIAHKLALRSFMKIKEEGSSPDNNGGSDVTSPASQASQSAPDSGLTLMTLGNYSEIMQRNQNGVVIVFHTKYSDKSNQLLETLQQIVQRKLLRPPPTIAIVYSVAETELATMYNVSWFPEVIYTPPLSQDRRNSQCSEESAKGQPLSTEKSSNVSSPSDAAGKPQSSPKDDNAAAPPLLPPGHVHGLRQCTFAHKPTILEQPQAGSLLSTDHPESLSSFIAYENEQKDGPCPMEILYGVTVDDPNGYSSSSPFFASNLRLDPHKSAELLHCIQHDNHVVYPSDGKLTATDLADWLNSKGQNAANTKKKESTRPATRRADFKFQQYRELHAAVVMLRRLQGNEKLLESSRPSHCHVTDCPLFIFLGGGMAAGKTTAAMALAHSPWWKKHKDKSVLVNADEFKVNNPNNAVPKGKVHNRSTRAAENLLVQAVNQGRSIVLDGTMMWAPFVQQVVEMVRKADTHLFKQGPGYKDDGSEEEYFVPSEERPTRLPMPYKIRFLGITVEPEIAVPRGFQRKFSSGRGVPIGVQLRSFKLFAKNFPLYASLVDAVTLYNNNVFVDLNKGELPPVLAEHDGEKSQHELVIHDQQAYQMFLRQCDLNEDADNIVELYPANNDSPSKEDSKKDSEKDKV